MIIHWNNRIQIQVLFEVPDPASGVLVPTNPTTAIFVVTDPNKIQTRYNWPGSSSITNPSPGVLVCTLLPPFLVIKDRKYHVEWLGYGAAQGGGEDYFLIQDTNQPVVIP